MGQAVNQNAIDILFNEARTYNGWLDKPVNEAQIKQIFDLLKMAPTSANCQPGRYVFITSDEAKERLKPLMAEGNREKTMTAPAIAIIGYDLDFYEKLPELFPHTDAKSWFVGNDDLIEFTSFQNGSLQGAYLIMAARALGLDCGPMNGFDRDGVKEEFFKGTNIVPNFICNLGYGDPESLHDRSPRPDFGDMAEIL